MKDELFEMRQTTNISNVTRIRGSIARSPNMTEE